MKGYDVIYAQTEYRTAYVEADSPEEAAQKAMDGDVITDEYVDFGDREVTDIGAA